MSKGKGGKRIIWGCRRWAAAIGGAFLVCLGPSTARAWGPVGHRMVAETAALIVEKNLASRPALSPWGEFLARHRFTLGVYAVMPDTVFKIADAKPTQKESPTHYFDLDYFVTGAGFTPKQRAEVIAIPREYKSAHTLLVQKLGSAAKADEAGSAPWRVKQFLDRGAHHLASVRRLPTGYLRGEATEGETRKIFDALLELGLLSHYSGDASMPFHATSDWNGFADGLGGIHFYFEADCINALEPALAPAVLKLAQKQQATWLKDWGAGAEGPVGVMLGVLFDSALKIQEVERLDRQFALVKAAQKGSKVFATRNPAPVACAGMRGLLVERLAKASVLTAWLWQQALPELEVVPESKPQPKVHVANAVLFYDWITSPTYIAPDYLP